MSLPRTAAEIREAYLSFFEQRGHQRLPSDSLIPSNDPTLLFTGAGMNQFKDEFLGCGRSDLSRATTSQKCLRVSDLENVGTTPRHHTFFEMLGNFSFGDYFKDETIQWEWEFFTEVLGFDPARMVASVFHDDDDAYQIWHDSVGLADERIFRLGADENFWPANAPTKGPNGPCGPCSEIYYDQDPGSPLPSAKGLVTLPDRFLEVGNFVFTQFDRQEDGSLPALPQNNIDVGLGLERIAAVLQDAPSNFETDLFAPTLELLQSISGHKYGKDSQTDIRMRRIADHCRAVFFCISDGAAPGREGRGYVVRKILRRAIRDGIGLGLEDTFLASLLPAVQATMGDAYPQLREQQSTIESMCEAEEERFREVFRKGISRLEEAVADSLSEGATVFPGSIAFELHDTWGFPIDITEVVVRDSGLEFDGEGFSQAMEAQRQRARAGSGISGEVFAESVNGKLRASGLPKSKFCGYQKTDCAAIVGAIMQDGSLVDSVAADTELEVLLDSTCFYAEGGGQVGDSGTLMSTEGGPMFIVSTTYQVEEYILHRGTSVSELKVGATVSAQVDTALRTATERHHTATHLLHAALKKVLGEHVNQAGSSVDAERLRFDYTNPSSPSGDQLGAIEALVNREVLRATTVGTETCTLEKARTEGITALFGEKYGDHVRVVSVPGFSAELCGGTHVANSGEIGLFRIVSERALSAGIRRIEAVAGEVAYALPCQQRDYLQELASKLKTPVESLLDKVDSLREQLKAAKLSSRATVPDAKTVAEELCSADHGGFAWYHLPGVDAQALRGVADSLKGNESLPPVCLLVGGDASEVPYVLLCSADSGQKAGDLAKLFGQKVGGGGGGRADFAQGKGNQGDSLEQAISDFRNELGSLA